MSWRGGSNHRSWFDPIVSLVREHRHHLQTVSAIQKLSQCKSMTKRATHEAAWRVYKQLACCTPRAFTCSTHSNTAIESDRKVSAKPLQVANSSKNARTEGTIELGCIRRSSIPERLQAVQAESSRSGMRFRDQRMNL
jgi:hypothetical protein